MQNLIIYATAEVYYVGSTGTDLEFRKGGLLCAQYLGTHKQIKLRLVAEIMSRFVKIVILPIFTLK